MFIHCNLYSHNSPCINIHSESDVAADLFCFIMTYIGETKGGQDLVLFINYWLDVDVGVALKNEGGSDHECKKEAGYMQINCFTGRLIIKIYFKIFNLECFDLNK